jgi:hypothetical protein
MNDPVGANMLFRAEHCRRLVGSITDERARQALQTMAEEIEKAGAPPASFPECPKHASA